MSANETRIMLWILAQLQERYPNDHWRRQNVVVAQADDRFIKAGTKGQADLIGCHQRFYVELEVKKPGEKQTPEQKTYEQLVLRAGGIYAVVHNPTEAFAVVDAL